MAFIQLPNIWVTSARILSLLGLAITSLNITVYSIGFLILAIGN